MSAFSVSVSSPSMSRAPFASLAALKYALFTLVAVHCFVLAWANSRFTNLQCEVLDEEFCQFTGCQLKMLRRGVVGLNVNVLLFKPPVTNVSINLSLFRKANGYRPFMYNITADFCDYMRRRKRHSFLGVVIELFMKSSNINHTCPFDHELIVKDLVLMESQLRLMPLPAGDYMVRMRVGAYNQWKADVKIYLFVAGIK